MLRSSIALGLLLLLVACGGDDPKEGAKDTVATDRAGGGEPGLKDLVAPPGRAPTGTGGTAIDTPSIADPYARAAKLLESSDFEKRAEAVEVLRAEEGDVARRGALIAGVLQDEDEDVRYLAAQALGELNWKPGAESMNARLQQGEESDLVRTQLLQSLVALTGAEAVPVLVDVLKNDDAGRVRATAASLLGDTKSEQALEPLMSRLSGTDYDFDDNVRLAAVTSLHALGNVKAFDVVLGATDDRNALVRSAAVKALGDLGEKKAIRPLMEILLAEETDPDVRNQASVAVAKLIDLKAEDRAGLTWDPNSTTEQAEAVIAAWRKWWDAEQENY